MKYTLDALHKAVLPAVEELKAITDQDKVLAAFKAVGNMSDDEFAEKIGSISTSVCNFTPDQYVADIQMHNAILIIVNQYLKPILLKMVACDPKDIAECKYDHTTKGQWNSLWLKFRSLWSNRILPRGKCPALDAMGLYRIPADFERYAVRIQNNKTGDTIADLGWKKGQIATLFELMKYYWIDEGGELFGRVVKDREEYIKFWKEFDAKCKTADIKSRQEYSKLDDEEPQSNQEIIDEVEEDEGEGIWIADLFGPTSDIATFRWDIAQYIEGRHESNNIMTFDLRPLVEKIVNTVD